MLHVDIAWIATAVIAVATVSAGAAQKAGTIEPGPDTLRARSRLVVEVPPPRKSTEARWVADWDAAFVEAERRNVPVVAVLCDEGQGFRTVHKRVYTKPEFAAFSHDVVLLAAYDGKKHDAKKRIVDGSEVEWCPLFDVACDAHRASFTKVRDTFAQREFWNPLHVFVTAQGIELTRAEGHEIEFVRLKEELEHATRERKGLWLPYREWRELCERLKTTVDQRSSRGTAAIHGELGKLLAAEKKANADPQMPHVLHTPAMEKFVEELRVALIEEAEGLVDDAIAAARRGEVAPARKQLGAVARDTKGLPIEKRALEELAKLPPAEPEKRKGG